MSSDEEADENTDDGDECDGEEVVVSAIDTLITILDDDHDAGEPVQVWGNIAVRRCDTDRPIYEAFVDGVRRDAVDVSKFKTSGKLNAHLLGLVPRKDGDSDEEADDEDAPATPRGVSDAGVGVH
jgi:hypothetical protein